jgi:phospholipid/cholesterol/gamma-HCH transport system ATP-binding protein
VLEALRFVELEQVIDKFPSELSGGMRRRVSIARAIISKPDLILVRLADGWAGSDYVDDDYGAGDQAARRVAYDLPADYASAAGCVHAGDASLQHAGKEGRTIPDNGIDPSTKFLVLNEGHIVFDGTTLELTHTKDPWLREYIE